MIGRMHDPVQILRALPLEAFEAPRAEEAWARCSLASVSDAILVQAAAAAISPPKLRIDSSFLLHAPLELLARAWHLQQLPPGRREPTRRRIAELAVRYAASGPEIQCGPKAYPDATRALSALRSALRGGDAAGVDSALLFLLPRASRDQLRAALADEILPLLGAAAHAPILLMLLCGSAGRFPGATALLRAPLRALALESDLRLTWMDDIQEPAAGDASGLFDCLAAAPHQIASPSKSIAPTMLAVERDGHAAGVLAAATSAATAGDAERALLRVAALSMLQDDPSHAPYGWTHCFTLPQSILSLADVVSSTVRTVRIAATHALGFRATLGRTALVYPFEPGSESAAPFLDLEPADAAAVAFHVAGDERRALTRQLIEYGGAHADAHVSKYTMACLLAADRCPEDAPLYLAAATYLASWWRSH
jgi:hypothetical protein